MGVESLRNGPLERAYWILAHPGIHCRDDGRTVVTLLKSEHEVGAMSAEELLLLAQAYEWCGRHLDALETAERYLRMAPDDVERLLLFDIYATQAYRNEPVLFLSACDRCLGEELGSPAFWLLRKADLYVELAKYAGLPCGCKWQPERLLHPDLMGLAAAAMTAALTIDSRLDAGSDPPSWKGDWNRRFAAVLQEPIYWHLAQDS